MERVSISSKAAAVVLTYQSIKNLDFILVACLPTDVRRGVLEGHDFAKIENTYELK